MNKHYAKIAIILLFLFIAVLPYFWFEKGYFIAWTDAPLPLRQWDYLQTLIYMWSGIPNGGNPNNISPTALFTFGPLYLVNFIIFHLDIISVQKIFFSIWLLLPAVTSAMLGNFLYRTYKHKAVFIFFFILFYSFNLYRSIMFGDVAHMSIYAAAPLLLLFTIKALDEEKGYFKYAIYIALSSIIASGAGDNPPMYVIYLLPPGVYILFFLTEKLRLKKFNYFFIEVIKFMLSTIVLSALINSYWLLPFLNQYFQTAVSGNLQSMNLLNWNAGLSGVTSITNILRMQGAWDWYSGYANDPYIPYAYFYQTNFFLLFLGFILPILSFSALYILRNRYTLFFTFLVLLGIIFSQGSHPPFGPIFDFLSNHVPLFWIFRSTWYKFSFLVALGYSYLGAITVGYVFTYLKNNKVLYLRLLPIFLAIVLLSTLIYAYPFIDGEKFPKKGVHKVLPASQIKIPSYILESAQWINNQSETFRIFSFPNLPAFNYNWDFSGLNDITFYLYNKGEFFPANQVGTDGNLTGVGSINSQIYHDVYYGKIDQALRLSGMLNIKYLVEKDDLRYDFYGAYDSPEFVNSQLERIPKINNRKDFGSWHFYQLPKSYYLPLIYVPQTVIFTDTNISSMDSIISQTKVDNRPVVLFADAQNISIPRKLFIQKYFVKSDCIVCGIDDWNTIKNVIQIPTVQFLPGSLLYFFVTLQENSLISNYNKVPIQRGELDLMFSNKRLSEINQLILRKGRSTTESIITNTVKRYEESIDDAYRQINKLPFIEKNSSQIKMLAYLSVQKNYLQTFYSKSAPYHTTITSLNHFINQYYTTLKNNSWMTASLSDKKYLFSLESTGIYNINISDQKITPERVVIDGNTIQDIKKVYLQSGVHKLELIYPPQNNLVNEDFDLDKRITLKSGEKIVFGMKGFNYKNTYQISFKYTLLQGENPSFIMIQDNDRKDAIAHTYGQRLDLSTTKNHLTNYYVTLIPNLAAKNISFAISAPKNSKQKSTFEIQDFAISNTFTPTVILSRIKSTDVVSLPKITFQRINPTKYIVHVENATSPYLINFGETYDRGWKSYILGKNFQSIQSKTGISASYFNGNIKEMNATNLFFDKSFFPLLFSKPIPEVDHIETNGYANGWYIQKKGSYDIVVTYFPQQIFIGGIIVSVLTFFGITSFLMKRKVKYGKK